MSESCSRPTRRGRSRIVPSLLVVGLAVTLLVVVPAGPGGADGNEMPAAPLVARSLTAGGSHTCALLAGGAVKCWGGNAFGQLGLGDANSRGDGPGEMGDTLAAVSLGAGRTATAITAGNSHTCALLDNGAVKCWGGGGDGRLGLGDTSSRGDGPGEMGDTLAAVSLGASRTATAVSAGYNHTCAILDDGTVKCWGGNLVGQLGLGDTAARGDGPGEMGDTLAAVSLGAGRTATAISAGGEFTCALLDNGGVKCWGGNPFGELGAGDTANRGDGPDEMGDFNGGVDLGTNRTATAISSGLAHTCVVLDDATMKCWGSNGFGQLGAGSTSTRGDGLGEMGDANPVVDLGPSRTAVAVTTGDVHTCAVLDDATVKCWGSNQFGQLGANFTFTGNRGDEPGEMGAFNTPISLGAARTATTVSAGRFHTCAALDNGSLKCWGDNSDGRLGVGDTQTRGDDAGEMVDALPTVFLETRTGISGTMTDSVSGQPVTGWVAVFRTTDGSIAGGAQADPAGQFSVALPAGSYGLYLIDPSGAHVAGLFGAPTTVTVTTGAMAAVSPTMVPARGTITGTVVEDTTLNPVGGSMAIALSGTTGAAEAGALANGAGQYSIPALTPGPRFVVLVDPAGAHSPEFFPNDPSLPAAPNVTVTAGGSATASASLATQPAQSGVALIGTVRATDSGARLAGMFVLALHASTFQIAKGAVTDAQGQYSMSVPAGPYKLAFIDPSGLHRMEWHLNQPFNGLATAASVTAPAATNATLDATTGSVGGTVRTDLADLPVSGAWALAIGSSGIAGGAVTATNGTYQVDGLPPANYRMAFIDAVGGGAVEYSEDSPTFDGATPFPVTAGNTASMGTALAAPGSDAFSSARTISGAAPAVDAINVGATKEPGEPDHVSAGGASVWFRWTAPASGTMAFQTCGSTFDTLLAVYTGAALGALTTAARNDDACGLNSGSAVSFKVTAGRTYHVAVDGFKTGGDPAATGTIQLTGSLT